MPPPQKVKKIIVRKNPNSEIKFGGITDGPSHADGGIKFKLPDGSTPELEGGEGVVNKRTMASKKIVTVVGTPAQIVSKVNSMDGHGVDFEPGAKIKEGAIFKDGGIIQDPVPDIEHLRKRSEEERCNCKHEDGGVIGRPHRAIIGEVGSGNLQPVNESLRIAKEMESAGRDEKSIIWLATGWQKDKKDKGKWKYDLPDLEWNADRTEYIDSVAKSVRQGDNHKSISWVKYLLNGDLLTAYPYIGELIIDFYYGTHPSAHPATYPSGTTRPRTISGGFFSPRDAKLGVNMEFIFGSGAGENRENDYWNDEEYQRKAKLSTNGQSDTLLRILWVLTHEIQHAIQFVEGFAKWGSPTLFNKIDPVKFQAQIYYLSLKAEYDIETHPKIKSEIKRDISLLSQLLSNWSSDNHERYKRLAGEIEARNAQKRFLMTPEERKAKMLSETQDMPDSDKLYLYESGGKTGALLAPNGKPSNLNPVQHALVRTDKFIHFFGDWLTMAQNPPSDRSEYLDSKDWYRAMQDQYVKDGKLIHSGKEKKFDMSIVPPVGTWRIDSKPGFPNLEFIDQLREVPIELLEGSELDKKGNVEPAKRDYVEVYAKWMKSGEMPPPLEVSETSDYKLRVVNGNRRLVAARKAGLKTLLCWVSPIMAYSSTGMQFGSNGKLIKSGMTYSGAMEAINECSKVVDDNGEPLVVWHGTLSDFTKFRIVNSNELSAHFGTSKLQARNAVIRKRNYSGNWEAKEIVIPLFLKIINPLKCRDLERWTPSKLLNNIIYPFDFKINSNVKPKAISEIIKIFEHNGYDGLYYDNMYEGDGNSYIAFHPTQIKLADGSNTEFDPSNPDIRFERGGSLPNNDKKAIYQEWKSLVNMTYQELKDFYESDKGKQAGLSQSEAKELGIHSGRESARWILKMLKTPYSEWSETMWGWAKRQIAFIKRMSGNKGKLRDENGNETRKLLSLKIWGNDPEKKYEQGGMIPIPQTSDYKFLLSDAEVEQLIKNGQTKLLGEVVDYPSFFDEFPDAKWIPVRFLPLSDNNSADSFTIFNKDYPKNYVYWEVVLKLRLKDGKQEYAPNTENDTALSKEAVLLHEIQHLRTGRTTGYFPRGYEEIRRDTHGQSEILRRFEEEARDAEADDDTRLLTDIQIRRDSEIRYLDKKAFAEYYNQPFEIEARAVVDQWCKENEFKYHGGGVIKSLTTGLEIVNGFYSPIEKSLLETKLENKSAKGWIEFFGKGDEVIYTGLKAFLESKKPTDQVKKSDILSFLKDNRIEIVEVVKGSKFNPDIRQYDGRNIDKKSVPGGDFLKKGDWILFNNGEPTPIFAKNKEYVISEGKHLFDTEGQFSETKYSQYQLEGEKENYKEVLVTLPRKSTFDKSKVEIIRNISSQTQGTTTILYDGEKIETFSDDPKLQQNGSYKQISEQEWIKTAERLYKEGGAFGVIKPRDNVFKSSHFDEPNILVHLRMNTRTDADGNKVLFLEEIQSDWGQKGKKEGFTGGEFTEQDNLRLKELEDKFLSDGISQSEITEKTNLERKKKGISLIPYAPFVTDTNAWTKLGLKVALKEAVKQGADKIAWTTGEQQNERYDLSKQISEIHYSGTNLKAYDMEGNIAIKRTGVLPEELPDIIGKDVAKKLLDSPKKGTLQSLVGMDLKIDGKGMIGFYGSPTEGKLGIVGELAKKLFKQEPKTVEIEGDFGYEKWKEELPDGYNFEKISYGWKISKGLELIGDGDTKQDAIYDAIQNGMPHPKSKRRLSTQHSIDITPEIIADLKSGLPLFMQGGIIPGIINFGKVKTRSVTRLGKVATKTKFQNGGVVNDKKVYHGTYLDGQLDSHGDGLIWVTDSRKTADQYRKRSILVNEMDWDMVEGDPSEITESESGIDVTAEESGIDLTKGKVHEGRLNIKKPLDLTGYSVNIDGIQEVWDDLHEKGLVDESWSEIDEEFQDEMKENYEGKALWKMIEEEGIYDTAKKKGYDSVIINDVGVDGRPHISYGLFGADKFIISLGKVATRKKFEEGGVVGKILPPEEAGNANVQFLISRARNYYTLWAKIKQPPRPGNPNPISLAYIAILSQNHEKAIEKAWQYAKRFANGESIPLAFVGDENFKIESIKRDSIGVINEVFSTEQLEAITKIPIASQKLGMGKYASVLVADLPQTDMDYVDWMVKNAYSGRMKEAAVYLKTNPEYLAWREAKTFKEEEAKKEFETKAEGILTQERIDLLKNFKIDATLDLANGGISLDGKTYDWKDTIKGMGGRWNGKWTLPPQGFEQFIAKLEELAPEKPGKKMGGIPTYVTDPYYAELRKKMEAYPDLSKLEKSISEYVAPETIELLHLGEKYGMPKFVVDEQVEDVAKIVNAYERNMPMFLLASQPGSGKTFVLGGAIRELKRLGAKTIVYVTLRKELIQQILDDLVKFDIGEVEFITYPELRTRDKIINADVLIFDEAHAIKNVGEQTQQAKRAASWIRKARFSIFSTATPFENPLQVEYAGSTGVFNNDFNSFEEFALTFGARKINVQGYDRLIYKRGVTSNKDLKEAREYFRKKGMLTTRKTKLPPGLTDVRMAKVKADGNFAFIYTKLTECIAKVQENLVGYAKFWFVNFQKRLLEASKIKAGIKEAEFALARGRFPIIFVETKAERIIDIEELIEKEAEYENAKKIAYAMHDKPPLRSDFGVPPEGVVPVLWDFMDNTGIEKIIIPSAEEEIQNAFGKEKVAIFTGSVSPAKAQKNLDEWRAGTKPLIVATMAKGGTGLSLHDKVGNHPTTQININLPWTATQVTQVAQRSARYGLVSKAEMIWLFTEDINFDKILASRVGGRMADMGAIVSGEEIAHASNLEDWDFDQTAFSEQLAPPDKAQSEIDFVDPNPMPETSIAEDDEETDIDADYEDYLKSLENKKFEMGGLFPEYHNIKSPNLKEYEAIKDSLAGKVRSIRSGINKVEKELQTAKDTFHVEQLKTALKVSKKALVNAEADYNDHIKLRDKYAEAGRKQLTMFASGGKTQNVDSIFLGSIKSKNGINEN